MDQRLHFTGRFIYGGTQKFAHFLNRIRENCIYHSGFQKTGTSDSETLYFEGRNIDKFQS